MSVELRHALIDRLIDVVAGDLEDEIPGVNARPSDDYAATVTANVIRQVIGGMIRRFPPGPQRDAFKVALAPMLAQPLGQLLSAQPPRVVAACLEGHAALLAVTLGATVTVNVTVDDASPKPHLKVVQ